jgi:hypothetical protein
MVFIRPDQFRNATFFRFASGRDQSIGSRFSVSRPALTCRWREASDGSLVMDWCLAEAKGQDPCCSIRTCESRAENPILDLGRLQPQRPKSRAMSVLEWIFIAILLASAAFATLMCFLGERNSSLL